MSDNYITDLARLVEQLSRFVSFVHYKNGQEGFISFRDSSGFLGREEDYKSRIAEEVRNELKFSEWKESWIGSGKIAARAIKAIDNAGNLINKNQKVNFKNRLNPEHPEYRKNAERVLYDIYRNPRCSDSEAFENAVATFGAKYDTLGLLFFVKDDTRFLPVSPGHFDAGFKILNIDLATSYKCGWENYKKFISIITEIRSVMEDVLPMQGTPRLIDAHSFVWIIQQKKFREWTPDAARSIQIEKNTEENLQELVSGKGGRKNSLVNVFVRSSEVVKETRKRAKGVCQYCNQPAPFIDKNGNPYLEVHHVIWLSRGGEDSTANTVALCPNCHARMHILDRPEDVKTLQSLISSYF